MWTNGEKKKPSHVFNAFLWCITMDLETVSEGNLEAEPGGPSEFRQCRNRPFALYTDLIPTNNRPAPLASSRFSIFIKQTKTKQKNPLPVCPGPHRLDTPFIQCCPISNPNACAAHIFDRLVIVLVYTNLYVVFFNYHEMNERISWINICVSHFYCFSIPFPFVRLV